jgi:cysteine desulfurase
VLFTGSATEANNLALRAAPALVTSRIEHPSVVRVAEAIEREGRPVRWLPVGASGAVEPEAVTEALRSLPAPRDAVVAVMAANHETGVLQPLAAVSERVAAAGARLHVDAVQAAGKVPGELWQHGDTLSLAAHKLRGPKGMGALLLRSSRTPIPVLLGGAQERGLRPGTLDAVAAAGFGAAARRAREGGPARHAGLRPLRDRLESALGRVAVVNGTAVRLPHVSNLSFDGHRGDELVAALDLLGVQVSSGSACSAGTTEPSAVVLAMVGRARAESVVRVSLGETTTHAEIDRAIELFFRGLGRHVSSGCRVT